MGAVNWQHRRGLGPRLVPFLLLGILVPAMAGAARAQDLGPPRIPGRPRPLSRVGELLEWLHREQQIDGGWTSRGRLPMESHVHARPDPSQHPAGPKQVWASAVLDTAMAGLAMARAGNAVNRGDYQADVRRAADFLYRKVVASGDGIAVETLPTPLGVRIGPHADTFFALLFFLEVAELSDAGASRYGGAIDVLVRKIQKNQKPDGAWGEVWDADVGHAGAGHAPMLGHAVGVWALESAARRGVTVEREVIALAEKYAMSEAAERNEWRTNDKWKKFRRRLADAGRDEPRWCVPRWLDDAGMEDDQSVNHELYLMAGRLAVLFQADATNQWLVQRDAAKLNGRSPIGDMVRLRNMKGAAERGRQVLEQGRQTMREGWIKIHRRDLDPSPAPLFFAGEDFLASLLTVDSMAAADDVEKWFLPTARRLMHLQLYDGGLLTDLHVRCHPKHCRFVHDSPYLCEWQLSWCSRDRVFMTSAALYMLVADTPYRPAVLGLDKTKAVEPLNARPPRARDGKPPPR